MLNVPTNRDPVRGRPSHQIGAKRPCSVVDNKTPPMIAGLIDRAAMVSNADRDVARLLQFRAAAAQRYERTPHERFADLSPASTVRIVLAT